MRYFLFLLLAKALLSLGIIKTTRAALLILLVARASDARRVFLAQPWVQ